MKNLLKITETEKKQILEMHNTKIISLVESDLIDKIKGFFKKQPKGHRFRVGQDVVCVKDYKLNPYSFYSTYSKGTHYTIKGLANCPKCKLPIVTVGDNLPSESEGQRCTRCNNISYIDGKLYVREDYFAPIDYLENQLSNIEKEGNDELESIEILNPALVENIK